MAWQPRVTACLSAHSWSATGAGVAQLQTISGVVQADHRLAAYHVVLLAKARVCGDGTFLWCTLRFRQIRAEELRTEAAAIVAERRGAVLEGLNLQASIPGVFAWLPAPPPAGERATLAYNKAHGALRCVSPLRQQGRRVCGCKAWAWQTCRLACNHHSKSPLLQRKHPFRCLSLH